MVTRSFVYGSALAIVLAACATSAPAPSAAPSAAVSAEGEQPARGGRVIHGWATDLKTMNPILSTDTTSGRAVTLLYDSLLETDRDDGTLRPRMATFRPSADGKTYSYTIDPKAVWSDGKPVVAEDWYVAKKLVAMSKISVRKSLFQNIVGWKEFTEGAATEISGVRIDPADPKSFSVTLDKVSCPASYDIPAYVLPAHVFGKYAAPGQGDAIDRAPENTAPDVVSGPFRFKEWRQGDQLILTRNDAYWRGAPYLDEYVLKVVADSDVLVAQLKTGELNHGAIPPKDVADMERQEHVRVTRVQALGYTYIGWRTNSQNVPALGDKRVRQALAFGLDTDGIIDAVLFGEAIRHVAHHVPVQWAYPDPRTLEQYAYDPAKARSLIEQAGYVAGPDGIYAKDGKRISFTIRFSAANRDWQTIAQIAQEQYKTIGVEAIPGPEAFQGLVSKLTAGDPGVDAVAIGWSLGPEGDPYSIWHSSQLPDPATKKTGFGFTFFKNAELDRALEEGRTPSNGDCSIEARKKHYATVNTILNDEQPYNFGFTGNVLYVTDARMQGFRPGSFGVGDVNEWWFKPPQ